MNLIEKLGGYDFVMIVRKKKTSNQYLNFNGRNIHFSKIDNELLEHRRENNIFECGDKIVLSKWANDFSRSHNGIYEILSFENDLETLALLSQDIRSSTQHIKHATPEEIKAGHRL